METSCIINTNYPFTHSQSFVTGEDGTLATIVNRLEQEGRVFNFSTSSKDMAYNKQMTGAFKYGFVLTFQLWGGSWIEMSWLDFMTGCLGSCNYNSSVVTYRNITIADI